MGMFEKQNKVREELKGQIDKLMQDYEKEEIDGATYAKKMMDLTTSYKEKFNK
ncbi:hypothetical protein [Hornefia butyriciproducens]|uniref:hypothetical protein n=1 Tax=Hornefia butyriciproducens TaxID=2652293 RepID=UPI0023F2888F|nr:hypothetical protein [Hornefia butyriciproducens]MDD6299692.1 hypothetical protein [Hornefia butyriciproducens]